MKSGESSRRHFLKRVGLAAGAAVASTRSMSAAKRKKAPGLHVACNQYTWITFYGREKRDFNASLDAGLKDVAASGVDGFEPGLSVPQDLDRLAPLLDKHGLEMQSLYVNSTLHNEAQAEKSIENVVAVAKKAKRIGTRIIVTNPNPIRWGGEESKNDTQLKLQAAALGKIGRALAAMDMKLAYHNHDVELRNAAREFHHMMVGTDPKYVTLCLDAHWIYRGSGNSAVALFDILNLYGQRVSELHLRQSDNGVWTESFGDGDIDYDALAKHFIDSGIKPLLVLEQAVENGTPKTMDPVAAHRKGCEYTRRIFRAFAD